MENTLLFNLDAYQKVQKNDTEVIRFQVDEFVLEMNYVVREGKAFVFGANATFGSLVRSRSMSERTYETLIDNLYRYLCDEYESFVIKLPPQYFDWMTNSAFFSYFSKTKTNLVVETNQFIKIDSDKNLSNFSKTNRKICKRLKMAGCRVILKSIIEKEGIDLLMKNRANRGVNLSLTYSLLEAQSDAMPNRYLYASCLDENNTLIAYAVCVKLTSEVLYVLYWGEELAARRRSPVVLICDALISYATTNDYKVLDVGISSNSGHLDENLFAFKKRLGCTSCQKLIIYENFK